jgi:hypothetical protein
MASSALPDELARLSLQVSNEEKDEDEKDEDDDEEEPNNGDEEEYEEEEYEDESEEEMEEEKSNNKPPEWKKSKARDYLYGLLARGELPDRHAIKPKQVFDDYCKDRPEFKYFQNYKEIKFASKLLYLRKMVEARTDRSKEDAAALAHDRLIFPPPTEDIKGRPIWAGSRAQKHLIDDIKNGKHKTMKPRLLYELREEYYENYDQDFFREKIYQEVKALKRVAWVKAKAEKAKNKKK